MPCGVAETMDGLHEVGLRIVFFVKRLHSLVAVPLPLQRAGQKNEQAQPRCVQMFLGHSECRRNKHHRRVALLWSECGLLMVARLVQNGNCVFVREMERDSEVERECERVKERDRDREKEMERQRVGVRERGERERERKRDSIMRASKKSIW